MLGVVFGVGSVVAMLAVGEGASKEALEQIRKVGSNNILINSVKSVEEEAPSTTRVRMSVYGLTYNDFDRISQTFSTIKEAVPVKLVREEGRLGERSLELRVVGTTPAWFDLVRRPIIGGRVLMPLDSINKAPVVVLTEFGARRLLATRNTIGQDIRIGGNSFRVIGIVMSEKGSSGGIQLPDQVVDAYIPIEVAKAYYGDTSIKRTSGSFEMKRVELDQIILEVTRMEEVERTAKGLEAMLERFHDKKDYVMSVPLALLKQAEATKRTFNIVLGSIAGISLLVGGIGIMNIMLASVTERTREIGIRRAIGAKKGQIITQFLIETVVLSTIGGIAGLGLGVFIPLLITYIAAMPTVITPLSIILPLVISMGIGIIFGLYPAARAAEVDPIIALRHE
ncbi:MAG: ABC transporter permease [Deltaproteobacteria bacterium]|nr:ABC transporter permease [Deltaproteobacteria bacterium]MBW2031130.1 ABC transporter permease [Deltaproteobacteria bacterium]MBW2128564.1 ABC transporter permease [Deltaproteobacteria bacterium]MBW2303312.1 ABC transporter permease [Deltaproteobacteria bacterium]